MQQREIIHIFFLPLITIQKLITPVSKDENLRRRERILFILLFAMSSLCLYFLATYGVNRWFKLIVGAPMTAGDSPTVVIIFCILFITLFIPARLGYSRIVSLIFLIILYCAATYTITMWGFTVPMGALLFVLNTVMAGILVGTNVALVSLFLNAATLLILGHIQLDADMDVAMRWMSIAPDYKDIAVIVAILTIISLVLYLFNREMDQALARAIESEEELRAQKDLLEIKVEERARSLKEAELQRMRELSRVINVGKLSSSLIHDLATPVTSVSINLKSLKGIHQGKGSIERAIVAVEQIEHFVLAARKQLQKQEIKQTFSVRSELDDIVVILKGKAHEENVTLITQGNHSTLYGNPLRFSQVLMNLIVNAIDAYSGVSRTTDRTVVVKCVKTSSNVFVEVKDFGVGISKRDMGHIFMPFFTTKPPENGIGLGLSIAREIAENEFGGTIAVTSSKERGTTFRLTFPLE